MSKDSIDESWIDAEKEVPDELVTVLVSTGGSRVTIGARYEGRWEVEFPPWDGPNDDYDLEVTDWQYLPLPTLPRDDSTDL